MKVVREIELRSDTMTKPTLEMRKAMFHAIVGDDGYGEDPTVKELEDMGAKVFGKEACRYFPTGLMGNLASVMSHCWERGSEVVLGDLSHIQLYEQGGVSTLANIHCRTVSNLPNGTFSIQELQEKIRPQFDVHQPRTSLICLENTHNRCSGAVLPLDFIDDVTRVARGNKLPVHVDGARVFNAAVSLGVSVDQVVKDCDSVSVCLSKGLGCPVGTLVAGSHEFIERATRCRKVLGGSMRQSGVLAATGIVALNSMVDRLADDHRHARMIAEAVSACKSDAVTVDLKRVQSNIVFLKVDPEVTSVPRFCERMRQITEEEKADLLDEAVIVRVNPFGQFVRIVTHADVSFEDTLLTIKKLKHVIGEIEKGATFETGHTNGVTINGYSSNGYH